MDDKYGKLYTEADVLAFAFALSGIEPVEIKARLTEATTTFPPDEPLFLLRGRDSAAPLAMGAYLGKCLYLRSPTEHANAVEAAIRDMDAWQRDNSERVKVPD